MIRRRWALVAALVLLAGWLGVIAYQSEGDPGLMIHSLGDSARRSSLPGLAAHAYLLAADWDRRQLYALSGERTGPAQQALVERIIAARLAAARILLDAGEVASAERVALEAARADYEHVGARAMLLEARLQGQKAQSARRDLMRLLLREEHPQVLYLLAESFIAENSLADAESTLQRALALDAGHFPSRLAWVKLQMARRDRQAALAALQQAQDAADTPARRQQVAALQQALYPERADWTLPLRHWLTDHWVTLLVALVYLLFLTSPTWLRRWRPAG
jgi:tetratricopeptide (TPR) repeat protein